MLIEPTRRAFLLSAPLAAAAASLGTQPSFAQASAASTPAQGFQLFNEAKLAEAMTALQSKPGNDNLFTSASLTVVMTTEEKKAAKEFEWHEGRDHIVHIIDGSTIYEVGGTPQQGRNTKPGEWLAPGSHGAEILDLRKGDMLVIPRGTPHKRSTAQSVTFYLISAM